MPADTIFDGATAIATLRSVEASAPLHFRPDAAAQELRSFLKSRGHELTVYELCKYETALHAMEQASTSIVTRAHASKGQLGPVADLYAIADAMNGG